MKINSSVPRGGIENNSQRSSEISAKNLPSIVSATEAKNSRIFLGSSSIATNRFTSQSLTDANISVSERARNVKQGSGQNKFKPTLDPIGEETFHTDQNFNVTIRGGPDNPHEEVFNLIPLNEKQVVERNTFSTPWVNNDFAPLYLNPPTALTDADFKPNIAVRGWQDPGGAPRAGLSSKNQAIVDFVQDSYTSTSTKWSFKRKDGTGDVEVEVNSKVFKRPDPKTYLTEVKIERHLSQFRDEPTFFLLKSIFDARCKDGIGRPDGQFLLTKADGDRIEEHLSDPSTFAQGMGELGLKSDEWVGKQIMRVTVSDIPNLRMASGNEGGTNQYWIPGGYLPGGLPEAVCDRLPHKNVTTKLLSVISVPPKDSSVS
jgi:hypothetical protein